MRSIITDDMEHCIVCGAPAQWHHCPSGCFRKKADKYGLLFPLCQRHHTGEEGVHTGNTELNLKLHRIAQKVFEKKYGHEKWMEEFRRNYL